MKRLFVLDTPSIMLAQLVLFGLSDTSISAATGAPNNEALAVWARQAILRRVRQL